MMLTVTACSLLHTSRLLDPLPVRDVDVRLEDFQPRNLQLILSNQDADEIKLHQTPYMINLVYHLPE